MKKVTFFTKFGCLLFIQVTTFSYADQTIDYLLGEKTPEKEPNKLGTVSTQYSATDDPNDVSGNSN